MARSRSRCAIRAGSSRCRHSRRSARRSQCPWGEKAFSGYLGNDRSAWLAHDACALMQSQVVAPYPGRHPGRPGPGRQIPRRATASAPVRSRLLRGRPAADAAPARGLRPRLLLHPELHRRPPGASRQDACGPEPASPRMNDRLPPLPEREQIALLEPFEGLGLQDIRVVATQQDAQAATNALLASRRGGLRHRIEADLREVRGLGRAARDPVRDAARGVAVPAASHRVPRRAGRVARVGGSD